DSRSPLRNVEVQLEDTVLRERKFETQGGRGFLHLADRIARGGEIEILSELLGDRARAPQPVAVAPRRADGGPEPVSAVHAERIRDFGGVDPDVRAEPRVLGDDDHALEDGRDVLEDGG